MGRKYFWTSHHAVVTTNAQRVSLHSIDKNQHGIALAKKYRVFCAQLIAKKKLSFNRTIRNMQNQSITSINIICVCSRKKDLKVCTESRKDWENMEKEIQAKEHVGGRIALKSHLFQLQSTREGLQKEVEGKNSDKVMGDNEGSSDEL